jgi:hypothetical protein
MIDPGWAIVLFDAWRNGQRSGIILSRPTRSLGIVKLGTPLFYDRQMTAR